MKTFNEYKEAYSYAKEYARETGMEMVLGKMNDLGVKKFKVAFATKSDADYYRCQIVKPESK